MHHGGLVLVLNEILKKKKKVKASISGRVSDMCQLLKNSAFSV